MLDIKFVRENTEFVIKSLQKRGYTIDFSEFLELNKKRLSLLKDAEELRNKRNNASQEIGRLKKSGHDVSSLMEEMKG
ncbi:MAG: serine--tRNA ligase, partial [Thermodesulfovibrionales bacterium]|nr:serine--tRNA ligase [Thermodesulfovibrionales bacterium]